MADFYKTAACHLCQPRTRAAQRVCSLLPNETILLNTIVLKEARASSEIENIVTTQDELYRALAADDR